VNVKQLKLDRTLVVEFTVIVVGVFLALAAETWWSEREERRFERELRADMIVEFESNIRILDADIATNEEARNRIGILDSLNDDALLALDDNKISEQLVPYLLWAGFDPEMGSVQAFVENGNVGAFSDRQLRLLLAQWSGLLVKNRRVNLLAVDFQHGEVLPVIARASSDQVWSSSERLELRVLLSHLLALHGFVLSNQHELRAAATDILTFLRDEHR
jgi:hypothetical protein